MLRKLLPICLVLSQLLPQIQAQNLSDQADRNVLHWGLSPHQEINFTDAQLQQMRLTNNAAQLLDGEIIDSALNDYISYVGLSVARHSPLVDLPWRFIILNHAAPLIFNSADFQIVISRGLLAQLDNEAELAFLFAHAMAHIQLQHDKQHHISDREASSAYSTLNFTKLANQFLDPALISQFDMLQHHYTVSEELHADELALKTIQSAAYSPQAAVTLLQDFTDMAKLPASPWRFVFASHSPSIQRVEAAKDQARLLGPGAQARARYNEQLAKLRLHNPAYEWQQQADSLCQQGNTEQGVTLLRKAISNNPEEALLPLSLARCLIRQQNAVEALAALSEAEKLNPYLYQVYLEKARLFIAAKQYRDAHIALLKSYRLLPLAETRYHLGEVAIVMGNNQDALAQLEALADTPAKSHWHQQAFDKLWQLRLQQEASDYLICEMKNVAHATPAERWHLRIKNLSPVNVHNIRLQLTSGESTVEYLWQENISATSTSDERPLNSLRALSSEHAVNPAIKNVSKNAEKSPVYCSVAAAKS